jgi:hypothetical protein
MSLSRNAMKTVVIIFLALATVALSGCEAMQQAYAQQQEDWNALTPQERMAYRTQEAQAWLQIADQINRQNEARLQATQPVLVMPVPAYCVNCR